MLDNQPVPEGVCLALLSHAIAKVNQSASDECNALRLAYQAAECDHFIGPKAQIQFTDDDDLDPNLLYCCHEIKETFHTRCDDEANGALSDQRLVVTILCIVTCLFTKELIRLNKITFLPEAAGCILVGLFGGFVLEFIPHFAFDFDEQLFLRVLLPPICFEAALSIDKDAFRRHIGPILSFALAGTLLSAVLCAVVLRYGSFLGDLSGGSLPWAESLAFGALISSIDPVAVIAVLNSLGVPQTEPLYVLIFGESLLNDGVAVVLFDTVVNYIRDDVAFDSSDFVAGILNFFKVFFGSILIGFLNGLFCTMYFRWMDKKMTDLVETLTFFLGALLSYYVCDSWHGSGIVGIVITGVMLDLYTMRHLSESSRKHVHFVVETISTLMETVIFAYLGVFMFTSTYRYDWSLIVFALFGMLASRAAMLVVVSFFVNILRCCRCSWRVRNRRAGRGSIDGEGDPDEHSPGEEQARNSGALNSSLLSVSLLSDRSSLYDADKPDINGPSVLVTNKNQFILWFAGLRGAMSFALVENIPLYDIITHEGTKFKPELRACVSVSIFFSIFVFGGMTHGLLEKMGITRSGSNGGESPRGVRLSEVLSSWGGARKYNEEEDEDNIDPSSRRMSKSISYDRVSSLLDPNENDSEVSVLTGGGLISDDGLDSGPNRKRVGHITDDDYFDAKATGLMHKESI
mmetsp:Transcript_10666/g.21209  ORF Transcript_10666/g.21209 Transcript_10666/m.21209 type:complete len:688 (-) Transcript_10666:28-2091(-)